MKSAFAIFGVALMVMVAVVPMVGVFSNEGSEAAAKEYVDDVVVNIYNADDDLSDMIYRGQKLPAGLDPAEWIPSSGSAVATWRNVNQLSNDYGKILTMEMTGLTHDQAVKAVIDSGLAFPMLEVTWTQLEDMSEYDVYLKVYRGSNVISVGDDGYMLQGKYPLVRNGAYFANGGIYTVSTNFLNAVSTAGDLYDGGATEFKTGKYTAVLAYNDKVVGTGSMNYINPDDPDDSVYIHGKVTDYNATPASAKGIPGAVIEYKVTTDGVATTGKTIAAVEDGLFFDKGEFAFSGPSGSIFEITKISAPGFTFEGTNYAYNYGTLTESPAPKQFMAKTGTSLVAYTVTDKAGAVTLSGVSVSASIYYGIQNTSTNKYNYTTAAPAGITAGNVNLVTTATDSDGVIYISYNAPTGEYTPVTDTVYLGSFVYLKAQPFSAFTFEYGVTGFTNLDAPIVAPVNKGDSWQAAPAAANFVSLETVGIVSVADADDDHPISGTTVSAKWYYQSYVDGKYNFTESKPATVNAGKIVMLNNGATSPILGIASFAFIAPTNQVEPAPAVNYSFFIYLTASNVTPFTFTKTTIATSAQTFDALVNGGEAGDWAYTAAGGNNGLILADQTKREVTITIAKPTWKTTGTIEIKLTGALETGDVIDIADMINPAAAQVVHTFYTLDGSAPVVTITSEGFNVKNGGIDYAKGYALPTVEANVDLAATMTLKGFSTVERSALGTYVAPSEGDDTVTTFNFTIGEGTAAAKAYSVTVLGEDATITVYGKATEVPTVGALIVTAEGDVETVTFDGTTPTVETLYVYNFVTTVAADPTQPSISEVVGGVEFYAKVVATGEIAFETTSGADGRVLVVSSYAPAIIIALTDFFVDDLCVEVYPIVDGPYSGGENCFAIDVANVIPGAITATVTPEISGAAIGHAAIRGIPVGPNEYAVGTVLTLVADNEYYNDQSGQTGYATLTEKVVFKGWYADGKLISSDAVTSYTVIGPVVLTPVYESVQLIDSTPKAVEQGGIDSTTLIIGIVAIVIALIAVAFVIISMKKKEA
jgi:hypothetical protein